MAIQIVQKRGLATEKNIKGSHHLFVLESATLKTFPFKKELDRKLKRTDKKMESLAKAPVTIETQDGHFLSFVILKEDKLKYQIHIPFKSLYKEISSHVHADRIN